MTSLPSRKASAVLGGCLLTVAFAAHAQPLEPSPPRVTVSLGEPVGLDVPATMRMLDRDGDGQISRREARDMTPLYTGFRRLDLNRDGHLDGQELARASLTPIF